MVAFRGTDSHSWYNWAENMRFWRSDFGLPFPGAEGALVHSGAVCNQQAVCRGVAREALRQHVLLQTGPRICLQLLWLTLKGRVGLSCVEDSEGYARDHKFGRRFTKCWHQRRPSILPAVCWRGMRASR